MLSLFDIEKYIINDNIMENQKASFISTERVRYPSRRPF